MNPEYLADALKACESDNVDCGWRDPKSPARFEAPGFLAAVMPITVDA